MTLPEFFLGLNAACCVLLGWRCWYLEGRATRLLGRLLAPTPPATPPTLEDLKKTRVWKLRKPTVFHRRRA